MKYACYLGVDTAPTEQLIAHRLSVPEICREIGADSLGYLSLAGLIEAIELPETTLCNACFHGRYPMPMELESDKHVLERRAQPGQAAQTTTGDRAGGGPDVASERQFVPLSSLSADH
jgi:glutamine phosphoribosylpyrophosphate amidotransferase